MYNILLSVFLMYSGIRVTTKPIKGVPIVGRARVAKVQTGAKHSAIKSVKPRVMSLHNFLLKHKGEFKAGKLGKLGNYKGTDTLSYWDPNAADLFYLKQPDSYDDSLYSIRFTPVNSGTLQGAAFYFYHLVGSGNVRIHVWGDNGGTPGTELGYVDVPTSNLITDGSDLSYIDLSSLNISVGSGDFYIGYSLLSGVDTLALIADTVNAPDDRSYDMYNGSWEQSTWLDPGWTWAINAYVNTSGGGGASYNLRPYQPTGWYSPLVISATQDDTTAAPPGNYSTAAGDSQYVHWAVLNEGPDDITDTFYIYLYREGTAIAGWYAPGLQANYYVYVKNYKIHESSDGSYTYQITADATNVISETDESDNSHSETYTWGQGGGGGGGSSTGPADFIIITSSTFAPYFQPLADWKNQKGVKTRIITLDTIYANYTGYDNAEKIRNFIKDMNTNYGTMYFLLGGQCDYEHGEEIVPRRNAYVFTSNAGYYNDEDTIITDLYYADLDGTWDGDGDHTYGETSDNVDMYPDVYVGRAPVKNTSQVQNFVNKVLSYERNSSTSTSYLKASFHPQGNLWDTNHGTSMPDTMVQFDPADWTHTFMREDIEGISESAANNEFDNGYQLVHFVGHGNEYGIYYGVQGSGGPIMNTSDADNLSNGFSKLSIVTSIACFSGAMDEAGSSANYDCLAEHLINATNGGAVAVMFNSRYGWGDGSQEGALGASGEQSKYFFRAIHQNGHYILGQAWADMESSMVPAAGSNQYYRWCLYERNLLGDPTLEIWTDVPVQLSMTVNADSILEGQDTVITVTVGDAKAPVQGAVVTLLQKFQGDSYSIYMVDTTDASGIASFTVHPESTEDIIVTSTKHNYFYSQDTIKVTPTTGVDNDNHAYNNTIRLLSNVLRDNLVVQYALTTATSINVRVYNITGRLVKTDKVRVNRGTGVLKLNVRDLKEGVYFVRISSQNMKKIQKVLKTR